MYGKGIGGVGSPQMYIAVGVCPHGFAYPDRQILDPHIIQLLRDARRSNHIHLNRKIASKYIPYAKNDCRVLSLRQTKDRKVVDFVANRPIWV